MDDADVGLGERRARRLDQRRERQAREGLALAAFARARQIGEDEMCIRDSFVTCLTGLGGVLAIMLSFVVYIFGQALVMPNALAAAMEPVPRMAGMAAGLMGMIQMGCGGIAGYAVNALYDGTALPMGGVILAMAIGTPGIYWAVLRRRAA